MKSTMQYLVLGLALAGVPLLAERDDNQAHICPTASGNNHGLFSALGTAPYLRGIEHKGEQVYLQLSNSDGYTVQIKAWPDQARPLDIPVNSRVQLVQEDRGWSISHHGQLLAFVPNHQGQALLDSQTS